MAKQLWPCNIELIAQTANILTSRYDQDDDHLKFMVITYVKFTSVSLCLYGHEYKMFLTQLIQTSKRTASFLWDIVSYERKKQNNKNDQSTYANLCSPG